MTGAVSLTVAIPTFSRREAVSARVSELLRGDLPECVRVLVIDNASPDGTFDHLKDAFDDARLTVLKNAENLGYAGNIMRLVDETTTDYLVFVSDEDQIQLDGLKSLLAFCAERAPLMVSPRAQTGGNDTYRGRRETRRIRDREFESASFYVSGLTFERGFVQSRVDTVRALIPANSAATVYPQVLLSALAIAVERGYFLDVVVSKQVVVHETHIGDPVAGRYNGVAGRWAQFLGYEEFFVAMMDGASPQERDRYASMREETRRMLHPLLIDGARREVPGIETYLAQPLTVRATRFTTRAIRGLRTRLLARLRPRR